MIDPPIVNPDGELMTCLSCGHCTVSITGYCSLCGGEDDGFLPLEDRYDEESGPDDVCEDASDESYWLTEISLSDDAAEEKSP